MNFNEAQSKSIYDFVMRYNSDDEFRDNVQSLYENDRGQLPILHIYALEEVLRYGNKGIFNVFLEAKGASSEDQAVDLYDGFVKLLHEDASFKQYKLEQLKNAPETLSAMETFAFVLIGDYKKEQEPVQEEEAALEYDPLTPIAFAYDKQIRETLEDLFMGEFIHHLLETPIMAPIKSRQKEAGVVANVDKPIVIEKMQQAIAAEGSMSKFNQVIDERYVKVKMALLMGKGEEAFAQFSKFNTNISANEVLGREKDTFAEDAYADLINMVNKRKASGERFTQEDAMDMINKMRENGSGSAKR